MKKDDTGTVLSHLLQFILGAFIPSARRSLDGKVAWCDEKEHGIWGQMSWVRSPHHHEQ